MPTNRKQSATSKKKTTKRKSKTASGTRTARKSRSESKELEAEELRLELAETVETGMDPALQNIAIEMAEGGGPDPALSYESDEGGMRVDVIARLADPEADVEGLNIASKIGNIVTGTVDANMIMEVRAHQNVTSLKTARRIGTHLQFSIPDVNASQATLSNGLPANVPSTGAENVIVGIVDFGCDFAHGNFLDPSGRTRLLSLWDQNGAPTATSPEPFGYGREFTADQIDTALQTGDPYGALRYRPRDGSHGTHVMDIAAGNGNATSQPGMAPSADLIFVELASNDFDEEQSFGNSRRLLEAVDYIFQKAKERGRPAVVNLSLGTHGGPHDGSTLVEQGFDTLLQEPGRAIVVSAGNSHERRSHATGSISPDDTTSIGWEISDFDPTGNELEIWYNGSAELAVTAETPSGQLLGPIPLGTTQVIRDGDDSLVGKLIHRKSDPGNGDHHIDLIFSNQLPRGTWRVEVENVGEETATFHAWIERDDRGQSRISAGDASADHTLGSISCGRESIVVGSYSSLSSSHELSRFTAEGPTRDGRQKPEISAPGQDIQAARATRQGITTKSGTSMAAPHVTGLIALMFGAANRPLSVQEVRRALAEATRQNPPGAGWDPRYGIGRIDALESIRGVLSVEAIPFPDAASAEIRADASGITNGVDRELLAQLTDGLGATASRQGVTVRFALEVSPSGQSLGASGTDRLGSDLLPGLDFASDVPTPSEIARELRRLIRNAVPGTSPESRDTLGEFFATEAGLRSFLLGPVRARWGIAVPSGGLLNRTIAQLALIIHGRLNQANVA